MLPVGAPLLFLDTRLARVWQACLDKALINSLFLCGASLGRELLLLQAPEQRRVPLGGRLDVGCGDPLLARPPLVICVAMSAQPVHEPDLDDPVEILRVLPDHFHDQFLREYYGAAAGAAREVGGYRQLHDVLRLWRLIAVAHSDPGFAGRLADVQEAVQSGRLEGSTPIEDMVPGWPGRL